ncbi:MAG TPA: SDR family NAD(P)-dependent oxidoreductase [Acidimicrobiales bacterium]|nr:SDR family NAD(P)-dependent oxidoreductase [Acidimicrobiales bacterium]
MVDEPASFELDLSRSSDPARRLAGRVAIVTGAGSGGPLPGIGVATAVLFASQGAQVGIIDVSPGRAANTLEVIERIGGTGMVVVADITRREECERAVAEVVDRFSHLDILVNNAAVVGGAGDPFDEEAWNRVVAVNLNGAMLMSKSALPHLRARGGAVVNMSSIAAMRGMGSGAYAATKAGLIGLTYDLAYSWGRDGIRVNCIAPGHLFTPMGNQGGEDMRERRRRAGLLGTEGTAWDAAWAALFLASEEARWITGVVVPVDAGTTASTALGLQTLEMRSPAP